jgi:hypothetical protein
VQIEGRASDAAVTPLLPYMAVSPFGGVSMGRTSEIRNLQLKSGFRVEVGWQHVTIAATLSDVCPCMWDTRIRSFGPILPYTIMGTTFANLFSI